MLLDNNKPYEKYGFARILRRGHATAFAQELDDFGLELPLLQRASSTRPPVAIASSPAARSPPSAAAASGRRRTAVSSSALLFDHFARLAAGAKLALVDKAGAVAAAAIRRGDKFVFAPDPDMAVAGIEDERPRAALTPVCAGQRQGFVTPLSGLRPRADAVAVATVRKLRRGRRCVVVALSGLQPRPPPCGAPTGTDIPMATRDQII